MKRPRRDDEEYVFPYDSGTLFGVMGQTMFNILIRTMTYTQMGALERAGCRQACRWIIKYEVWKHMMIRDFPVEYKRVDGDFRNHLWDCCYRKERTREKFYKQMYEYFKRGNTRSMLKDALWINVESTCSILHIYRPHVEDMRTLFRFKEKDAWYLACLFTRLDKIICLRSDIDKFGEEVTSEYWMSSCGYYQFRFKNRSITYYKIKGLHVRSYT